MKNFYLIWKTQNPTKNCKSYSDKCILRKNKNNPKFIELGERLEKLKLKHEQGMIESIDLLREMLDIANRTCRTSLVKLQLRILIKESLILLNCLKMLKMKVMKS